MLEHSRGLARELIVILLGSAASANAASCPGGGSGCEFTLQAESTPQEQPWTQPARFAYTINNGEKDSVAVDIAGKATIAVSKDLPLFLLADVSWHKTNQQKEPQNNLQVSGGFHFEVQSPPPTGPFNKDSLFSLWVDTKLGYNRKAVFADASKAPCNSDASLPVCQTQHVGSIRGTIDVSPYWGIFESEQSFTVQGADGSSTGVYDGPAIAHNFGVIGTFFYDNATEATLNPETGKQITGTVTGFKGKAGLALSPKFTSYRAVLRADVQAIQTTSRALLRQDDFDDFTHLVTVSLDWDLSDRSMLKDEKDIKPSIGITYTDGADPLTGRKDQSSWVIGLKLAYK